jgi:signal transduction histidine kinase
LQGRRARGFGGTAAAPPAPLLALSCEADVTEPTLDATGPDAPDALRRYGAAAAFTAIAVATAAVLQPYMAPSIFLAFYPAVALSAWYGGLVPALLASGVSVFAADYLFLDPVGQVSVADPAHLLRMAGFLAVSGIVALVTEERRRAEAVAATRAREAAHSAGRMAYLARVSETLSSTLDYREALRRLVEVSVPTLGDACGVDVVEEDGSIRRLAAAHVDPAMRETVEGLRRYPPDPDRPGLVGEVLRTGEPRLVARVPPEMARAAARDAEHLRLIEALNVGSAMIVPLRTHERVLGALSVTTDASGRELNEEDLRFALEVAGRAAVAVDNARLHTDVSEAAERLESQAAELEIQSEELQSQAAQMEEIQAELESANDELHRLNARLLSEAQAAYAARVEAEEANVAKSQFLATMSHELRTPLNAIAGYTELLEMGIHGPVTPEQAETLGRIRRNQQHLLGLINDVLNFAKLEAGQVRFELEAVALDDALGDLHPLVEPQMREKQISYGYVAGPEGLHVRADPERLQQIVLNLLTNAVKFTDTAGEVEVSWTREGDEARIHVRDTGRGIPPDKLQAVFEPFVQVNPTLTRDNEGTGLGLAISRDLARGMDGDLTARSTPGEGSTFTLSLPLVVD